MNTKEFDKLLDGARIANDAKSFATSDEKLIDLQQTVINLVEAKEEELCEEIIAKMKPKNILMKEIKARLEVVKAKEKFYKSFFGKLKMMKRAYDKMNK